MSDTSPQPLKHFPHIHPHTYNANGLLRLNKMKTKENTRQNYDALILLELLELEKSIYFSEKQTFTFTQKTVRIAHKQAITSLARGDETSIANKVIPTCQAILSLWEALCYGILSSRQQTTLLKLERRFVK